MLSSEHPKYRLSFFMLAVVFILSFSVQSVITWLESSISYGDLNLSFTSEALDLSLSIIHKDGKLYIAVPERGFSIIITHKEIKRFIRKYRLSVKITTLNILGSSTLLLLIFGTIFLARNWQALGRYFGRALSAIVGYSHFLLISSLLLVLVLASLFPLNAFLGWWRKFPFIKDYPVPGSLERAVYDFMTMFVVMPKHKLFYAFFLTLPSFFLQLIVQVSFSALIIFWLPVPKFIRGLFEKLSAAFTKIDARVLFFIGALSLLALTNSRSLYSYHHLPVSLPGTAMSFQAQIFQTGNLSYPSPDSKEFFEFPYLSNEIRWFSQFAPGWPALLSLGYWLRVPWLLNSLFAIGFLYIFYCFSRNIYDQDTAILSCLLLILSPVFTRTGAGFLQYPALFFFLWSFFYQIKRIETTDNNLPAVLAGIFWGISFNIDPKNSLSFGIPIIFYSMFLFARQKNGIKGGIFGVTAALSMVPFFLNNYFLSGKWWVFGTNHLYGATLSAQKKPFLDSLIFALARLDEINRSLFYWPIPSLTFFFIFIILLRTDKQRWDYLLILGFVGSFLAHVIYIDAHPGASNFLLVMIPIFILFSSRAIVLLPRWLSGLKLAPQRTAGLLWVILLILFLPKIDRLFSFPEEIPDLAAKLRQQNKEKALIFVDKDWEKYRVAFRMNHPDLKNSNYIAARDLGDYNRKLVSEFSDYPAYRYRPLEEVEFIPFEE